MKNKMGQVLEIKPETPLGNDKLTFSRVELRAQVSDDKPLVAADYAILDSLTDLPELELDGEQVDDAVLEHLRLVRAVALHREGHFADVVPEACKVTVSHGMISPPFGCKSCPQ